MNSTPTWFVLADTRVKPFTTLQLGQLITNPLNPQFSLQPLLIDSKDIRQGDPEENVEIVVDHNQSLKLGVGLVIANFFNFSIKAYRKREGRSVYKIDKVTTTSFIPDQHYFQRSMTQPAVIKYLKRNQHSVYMVVGLQVAHNARVGHSQARETSGGPDIGPVGLSALGIPVDVTINASLATHPSSTQSYSVLGDFVFAYRIRKCFYHRKLGVSSIESAYFAKGAELFDLHSKKETDENQGNEAKKSKPSIIIVPYEISNFDLNSKALKGVTESATGRATDQGGCDMIFLSQVAP